MLWSRNETRKGTDIGKGEWILQRMNREVKRDQVRKGCERHLKKSGSSETGRKLWGDFERCGMPLGFFLKKQLCLSFNRPAMGREQKQETPCGHPSEPEEGRQVLDQMAVVATARSHPVTDRCERQTDMTS